MIFKDRRDAGQQLAAKLIQYKDNPDVIVLGLPRGGVVVAQEVAKILNTPLDILVPRKIGAPDNPEFAIGAISEEGEGIFDSYTIQTYGISKDYLENTIAKEKAEAQRRLKLYRGDRPPLNLQGKIAILVDDGIATGATMRAAIKSAKAKGAKKIVVATPTAARESLRLIQKEADEIICVDTPLFFGAIGAFYESFPQIEDQEMVELMKESK